MGETEYIHGNGTKVGTNRGPTSLRAVTIRPEAVERVVCLVLDVA